MFEREPFQTQLEKRSQQNISEVDAMQSTDSSCSTEELAVALEIKEEVVASDVE